MAELRVTRAQPVSDNLVRFERATSPANRARLALEHQRLLTNLARRVAGLSSVDEILYTALSELQAAVDFRGGSVALINEADELQIAAAVGEIDPAALAHKIPVGQGIAGWVAAQSQPILIPDLDNPPATGPQPVGRSVGTNKELRSYLCVPIITAGTVIGVFQINSQRPMAFTQRHLELLELVAAQIAGGIQNARALALRELQVHELARLTLALQATIQERDQRVREFETLSSLSATVISDIRVNNVLHTLVMRVVEILKVRICCIYLPEADGNLHIKAARGIEDPALLEKSIAPDEGLTGLTFTTGEVQVANEAAHDSRMLPAFREGLDFQRALHVPLKTYGRVIGVMNVCDKVDGSPFTPAEVQLLQVFSNQAAVAIRNSQLYHGMEHALKQSKALVQLASEFAGELEINTLLGRLVVRSRELLDADYVAVATQKPDGQTLWRAISGNLTEVWRETVFQVGQGTAGRVLATGRPVIIERLGDHPDFPATEFPIHVAEGGRTAFGVPLFNKGRAFGVVIAGYRSDRQISPATIELAQAVANMAAVSITNAELVASLASERSRLEHLLNLAPVAIALVEGAEQRITYMNPTWRQTWPRPAVTGKSLAQAFPELVAAGLDLPLAQVLDSGEARTVNEQRIRVQHGSDPTEAFWTFNMQPWLSPEGQILGVLLTGIETTASVQARRALEALTQQKDEFLAAAAHDLKNPITTMKGTAQVALRRLQRGETAREQAVASLKAVNEQADRMERLVEDLLDISRLQMGRPLELRRSPVDLEALAERILDRQRAAMQHHQFSFQGRSKPLIGQWDELRIERVLTNLLENAVKYSPQGGQVLVSLGREHEQAWLSVSDQGIGIPAEALPHLFERFYRAPNATDTSVGGMGLGLYFSQRIVSQHGGRIDVQSQPGQGSRFTVWLPLEEEGQRTEDDTLLVDRG